MFKPVYSKEVAKCLGLDKKLRTKRLLLLSLGLVASFALAKLDHDRNAAALVLEQRANSVASIQKVAEPPPQSPVDKKIVIIADYVSKNYRIAHDAAVHIVKTTFSATDKAPNVDPVTIVAIMAVESSFNPIAESVAGAKGLTQSLPRAHPEKMRDLKRKNGHILDISDNIAVGVKIYSEYLDKFNGDETRALQQYNGSLSDKTREYSKKVLLVKGRIRSHLSSAADGRESGKG